MADATHSFQQQVLNLLKSGPLYVALFTASPGESGSFAAEVPASGTGYARALVTLGGNVDQANGSLAASTGNVTFPAPTAAWGTILYAGLADAATAGNLKLYGLLPMSFVPVVGVAPVIPASMINALVR